MESHNLKRSFVQQGLCAVFAQVYKRWLWDEYHKTYDKVLHVHSWRSARVATIGGKTGREVSRRWMQPCFWIFN